MKVSLKSFKNKATKIYKIETILVQSFSPLQTCFNVMSEFNMN
jgi:hypothetical protein